MSKAKHSVARAFVIIVVLVVIALGVLSIAIVGPGERGVLLTFGKVEDKILGEGFHTKLPIAQSVFNMDVKTQKYTSDETSASKDLQDVSTEVTVNYHIDPLKANFIYQTLTSQYEGRVIEPSVSESIKAITAEYNAEELITKRAEVRNAIETQVKSKLTKFNIIVDQVSITEFDFSDEFTAAIEAKVVAVQKKLKAENDLERIIVEKQQAITLAEGQAGALLAKAKAEAEAIAIQGQALQQNPEVLTLRQIEKWNGVLPRVLLQSSTSETPFIFDVSSEGE